METPFSAYQGDEPYIFVCYAHDDAALVYPEITRLHEAGFHVWYDEGVSPGSEWSESLAQHIEQCVVLLYFVTPKSVEREHCRQEINFALDQHCTILPVHLEETQMPSALKLSLSHRQAILKHQHPSKAYEEKLDHALETAVFGRAETLDLDAVPVSAKKAPSTPWMKYLGIGLATVVAALIVLMLPRLSEVVSPSESVTQRLAILPLRNLSPDADIDWLAGGLTEELRRQISGWGLFEVLPGALVKDRSILELEADADLVIDGFLQTEGEEVSVNLEVIRLADGSNIWSQTFTGSLADPMTLQRQIAANVARVFNLSVSPNIGPTRQEAYPAYLRYLDIGGYGNLDDRLYWLERTLALDPEWVGGWLDLSGRRLQFHFQLNDRRELERAKSALDQAEQLGAEQWFGNFGLYAAYGEGDLDQGEKNFRGIAEAGFPSLYVALMLNSGLYAEGEAALRYIVEERPHDASAWEYLAMARANLGDGAGAQKAFERVAILNPAVSYSAVALRVLGETLAGDLESAKVRLAQLKVLTAKAGPDALSKRNRVFFYKSAALLVALLEEDRATALDIADWFTEQGQYARAGLYYVLLDDPRAQAIIEKAATDLPAPLYGWFYSTAMLSEEQRSHPLIKRIESDLGITPEWRLELCRRAATLPPETHIKCDPSKYEL